MIETNKLKRMWMEVVVAKFRYICLEESSFNAYVNLLGL
jgi:hypothetical protein